jgi:putative ABC transport system permease protein
VGLAVVLLIGAALLIRTSLAPSGVNPGFDPSNVLTMHNDADKRAVFGPQNVAQTIRAGLQNVRAMPGVESAGATGYLPPGGALSMPFNVLGRRPVEGRFVGSAGTVPSSAGYFAALGIPVIRGRAFRDRDDLGAPPVAVINQTMAKRFWANGADPLQDRILIGGRTLPGDEPARQIVGIVGDAHYGGLDKEPEPTLYVPVSQLAMPEHEVFLQVGVPIAWIVRTRGNPEVPAEAIRNAIRDATAPPVVDVAPMERVVAGSVAGQRLNMLLMSIFGGAALLLAAIGIYGVMAYSVEQRVRDIGIRMALGADAGSVKRAVVRQGLLLAAVGIGAGLLAAFYMADVLASFLFEVEPRDPAVFVAVPVVLALIAVASVWVPAGRAGRVDPLSALRHE